VWLATHDKADITSGGYYIGEKEIEPAPNAADDTLAARLWAVSMTALQLGQ
jgi:hypothetical protein